MVLLGVNHSIFAHTFASHFDALHMTEMYEYSQTLIGNVGLAGGLPHLQAYKLVYASWLADHGFLELASRYCEGIEQILKNYVKGSPYFHRTFIEALRDLVDRLATAQLRVSGSTSESKESGSWFSKVSRFDGLMNALDRGLNKFMNGAIGEVPSEPESNAAAISRNSSAAGKKGPSIPLMDASTNASSFGQPTGSVPPSIVRPSSSPAAVLSNDVGQPGSGSDYPYGYSSYGDNQQYGNSAQQESAPIDNGSFVLASAMVPQFSNGAQGQDAGYDTTGYNVEGDAAVSTQPYGYDASSYDPNGYGGHYDNSNANYGQNYDQNYGQDYGYGDYENGNYDETGLNYQSGSVENNSQGNNFQGNTWSGQDQGYGQADNSYGYDNVDYNNKEQQNIYDHGNSWSQGQNDVALPPSTNTALYGNVNDVAPPPQADYASYGNGNISVPNESASVHPPPPPKAETPLPPPPAQRSSFDKAAAPPAASLPPRPQSQHSLQQASAIEDEDDLGFGNNALKKAVSVPDSSKISDDKTDEKADADSSNEKATGKCLFGVSRYVY
jgi:hypothetical protein